MVQLPIVAVSGGTFDAVRATVRTGRAFDDGDNTRRDAVAVLGPAAAQRLNVTRVDQGPVVFVDERPLVIVGILDGVVRQPELLGAIIVPDGIARTRFDLASPAEVHVDVEVGAAELIGSQAALALDPDQPERLRVSVPRSPRGVQEQVQADVNGLFLVLGGIIGASAGILTVVGVSATGNWSPVLDPWLPFAAPLTGLAIDVAGADPAWKVTSIEPISALRQGM